MVRAFLISFVARQIMFTSRERVALTYKNPWLVWEPGAWIAPDPGKHLTLIPAAPGAERPMQGDALCFELALGTKPGLKLGRADDCDIVINDATVSRSHLWLAVEPEGWVALVMPSSSRGVLSGGQTLGPGGRIPLRRGTQFQVGEVTLSFYDPEGFLLRAER